MSPTTSEAPTGTSDPSAQRRRVSWGPRLLVIGLVLFAVVIVGFYVTIFFGVVIGQEFSPDLFKRREFQYYEIPVIRMKVSPINRSDDTGDLETYLLGEGILTAKTKPDEARWDLVQAQRGMAPNRSSGTSRGDALILCQYLDAEDSENNELWLQWTKDNSSLAKVLWPVVAKLAQQQLYLLIPDVFAVVQEGGDPDEIRKKIDQVLLAKYLAFASCQQELERHTEAIELYAEALKHGPGSTAALEGRAKSLSALGRHEEANADRRKIKTSKK